MPASFAEEVAQLLLGDLLPRHQPEGAEPATHPAPGRDTSLLLGLLQQHPGWAAAITDNRLARVITLHLTGIHDHRVHHADHATRP